MNNRVSPATVELLIRERSKGKSLRQLGQMFGTSHEKVRQLLAKHNWLQITLLPEGRVATKLGYPEGWLARLRKQGIIKPVKPGGFWLYSEEQVRQIPSLIAEMRRCEQCGKPFRPNTVTRAFQTIAESAGLKGARLHDLRHAHATVMLQQGVHPKIVQERLGHSSVATTLDIYSHVLPGLQEAAARRFEEGLRGALSKPRTVEVGQ